MHGLVASLLFSTCWADSAVVDWTIFQKEITVGGDQCVYSTNGEVSYEGTLEYKDGRARPWFSNVAGLSILYWWFEPDCDGTGAYPPMWIAGPPAALPFLQEGRTPQRCPYKTINEKLGGWDGYGGYSSFPTIDDYPPSGKWHRNCYSFLGNDWHYYTFSIETEGCGARQDFKYRFPPWDDTTKCSDEESRRNQTRTMEESCASEARGCPCKNRKYSAINAAFKRKHFAEFPVDTRTIPLCVTSSTTTTTTTTTTTSPSTTRFQTTSSSSSTTTSSTSSSSSSSPSSPASPASPARSPTTPPTISSDGTAGTPRKTATVAAAADTTRLPLNVDGAGQTQTGTSGTGLSIGDRVEVTWRGKGHTAIVAQVYPETNAVDVVYEADGSVGRYLTAELYGLKLLTAAAVVAADGAGNGGTDPNAVENGPNDDADNGSTGNSTNSKKIGGGLIATIVMLVVILPGCACAWWMHKQKAGGNGNGNEGGGGGGGGSRNQHQNQTNQPNHVTNPAYTKNYLGSGNSNSNSNINSNGTAASQCLLKTSKGRCKNTALVGGSERYCRDHTCSIPGCANSKSSKLTYCPDHLNTKGRLRSSSAGTKQAALKGSSDDGGPYDRQRGASYTVAAVEAPRPRSRSSGGGAKEGGDASGRVQKGGGALHKGGKNDEGKHKVSVYNGFEEDNEEEDC